MHYPINLCKSCESWGQKGDFINTFKYWVFIILNCFAVLNRYYSYLFYRGSHSHVSISSSLSWPSPQVSYRHLFITRYFWVFLHFRHDDSYRDCFATVGRSFSWSGGKLTVWLRDWLSVCLSDWLPLSPSYWPIDWMIDCLSYSLTHEHWLTAFVCLIDWMTHCLSDWWTDWLFDLLAD